MLPSPDSMQGMRQAVACILSTCRAHKPIFIHGDYDVDGISATAMLTAFLKEIGVSSYSYIPNRLEEPYGLSESSINRLVMQSDLVQGGLLISVDCGITAVKEVLYAKALGLRVVITDHHEPKEILPDAEAILNPKQQGCTFPFPHLSGVGVAFFLIIALRKAFVEDGTLALDNLPNLKKYLDLVALGTVADVVPLVGVNRILVRAGLEVLSEKNRFGILSLCQCSGIGDRRILSEDIAFKLAPRINASGRLGSPKLGLALFSVETQEEGRLVAEKLEGMNTQRKELEVEALSGIDIECQAQVQAGLSGLTVYQNHCHPGVLGILASRMTDRFNRPAIIFTDETAKGSGPLLKGSGRSIPGINLFQIVEGCSPWIEQYGGHAMAVGLTIKKSHLEHFRQEMHRLTSLHSAILHKAPAIPVDYHFQDKEILTRNFAQALQKMQPFGEGNPEPMFLLSGERLLQPRDIKGHVTFQIQANRSVFSGIGFRLADGKNNFQKPVDLVFQLKQSWFRGIERAQIQAFHFLST